MATAPILPTPPSIPMPMPTRYRRNQTIMWILFAALVILHHDWWFWNDPTLLFKFLPIGLGYQIAISLAASVLWAWAAFNAWPDHYDTLTADLPPRDLPGH